MAFMGVDHIQLAYTDTGIGQPVVLLHGYPFNRTLWNEQVSALSNSYRVITPDLRGLGESGATSGAATMNRMAQDVAALLDQLEISRAVIGGLSMGGYVALAYYKQFPSRVRALVLTDTMMVEPGRFALTTTPSIFPSSAEVTVPVRAAGFCAIAG